MIAIVDYKAGNLTSVRLAFEALGHFLQVLLLLLHELGHVEGRDLELLAELLEHVGEVLSWIGHANLLSVTGRASTPVPGRARPIRQAPRSWHH